MTIYDNLEVMLRDMVGFMRAAPDVEILAADDPRQGLWGYTARTFDPMATWEIPVSVLAQENAPAYVREAVRTREGRIGLVNNLRNMARQNVMSPDQLADLRVDWSRGNAGGARVELRPMRLTDAIQTGIPEPPRPAQDLAIPVPPPASWAEEPKVEPASVVCWDFLDTGNPADGVARREEDDLMDALAEAARLGEGK